MRCSGRETEATGWFRHQLHVREWEVTYVNWAFVMINVREISCHVRVLEFNQRHVRKVYNTYVRIVWQCIKCTPFRSTTALFCLTTFQNKERDINTCWWSQKQQQEHKSIYFLQLPSIKSLIFLSLNWYKCVSLNSYRWFLYHRLNIFYWWVLALIRVIVSGIKRVGLLVGFYSWTEIKKV